MTSPSQVSHQPMVFHFDDDFGPLVDELGITQIRTAIYKGVMNIVENMQDARNRLIIQVWAAVWDGLKGKITPPPRKDIIFILCFLYYRTRVLFSKLE